MQAPPHRRRLPLLNALRPAQVSWRPITPLHHHNRSRRRFTLPPAALLIWRVGKWSHTTVPAVGL
uniref:Uncharacterized protein n=1 Tax=Arundo donax TaxID=35708 RepID=A0A0A9BJ70_ARUDO